MALADAERGRCATSRPRTARCLLRSIGPFWPLYAAGPPDFWHGAKPHRLRSDLVWLAEACKLLKRAISSGDGTTFRGPETGRQVCARPTGRD